MTAVASAVAALAVLAGAAVATRPAWGEGRPAAVVVLPEPPRPDPTVPSEPAGDPDGWLEVVIASRVGGIDPAPPALLAGLGQRPPPPTALTGGPRLPDQPDLRGRTARRPPAHAEGLASWYGAAFAGRRTASGETFDPRALTAAHRTLPFGTRVRVTNLRSGASVVVRVNDRGPFIGGRIIDLSEAAAEQIGMRRAGVVRVRLEILGR